MREFLNDPVNKKSGWKSKDARFFRLGFNTVARENNFNPLSVGVTPTPARSNTTKGSMNLNVKSKEKKVPPLIEEMQDKKNDDEVIYLHYDIVSNYKKLHPYLLETKPNPYHN